MTFVVWVVGMVLLVTALFVVWLRVPPVPSRKQELEIVLDFADIKSGDVVFDLGAGDGRVLDVVQHRFGAKVAGWEINPLIWLLANLRLGFGIVRYGSLWNAPVERADVVFVFLMANLMGRVKVEIWDKMKSGARLVSNAFVLPGVEPVREKDGVYLYIKP